jgi:zinc protease
MRPLMPLGGVLLGTLMAMTTTASASPPKIQSHTLGNGLEVLVVENHAVPLITVEIAVKNGAMAEPPEFNGLSHLYEHMFFKANAVIPNQEAYMARVQELGISFNGTTGNERVNYFFTTTSDHLDDSMVFMRDAIMTTKFDDKELERERVVVTGEMDRAEANPYYLWGKEVEKHVWYKYPTRKEALGSRKTVLTATTEMMRTIQKRYYIPNNSVLVVTGDVKAADIFAQADTLYAGWARGADPFIKFPLVTHPALKKSEVVVMEKDIVQTFVGQMVWHGPSTVEKELDMTYAADAFGTILAEPTSRFQKALVESGLCVSASIGWYTQRNVGPITLSFQATPEKVPSCIKGIEAEIAAMSAPDYVSAEEIAAATYTLKVAQVMERERASALAHLITFWWASASIDYYLHYTDNIAKVTPAAVSQFVNTYIKDKHFVFGAMVSPAMTKDGLNEAKLAELAGIGKKGGQ